MKEDLRLIAHMLRARFHKATMNAAQRELYDTVGETYTSDSEKQEVTLTIPAGAKEKDVKKVKRQFLYEAGAWPVRFVTADAQTKPPAPAQKTPKP